MNIIAILYVLFFLTKVFEAQCAFFTRSTSQFGPAVFRALVAHDAHPGQRRAAPHLSLSRAVAPGITHHGPRVQAQNPLVWGLVLL